MHFKAALWKKSQIWFTAAGPLSLYTRFPIKPMWALYFSIILQFSFFVKINDIVLGAISK